VGLVVFAGEAFVQCPLTTDYDAARLFLRAVGPGSVPQQGSDLGLALRAAREVLDAAEGGGARSKVVLLVSDGEDLEGGAAEAAGQLSDAGVRIFALAVGRPQGAPIPLLDAAGQVTGYKKDRRGEAVLTRLDEAGLRALVERAGGELYEVGSPDRGPAAFLTALDQLAKSELEQRLTVQYEERYALLAFPGFLALLASLLVREGRRRREAEEDAP
jgi:Ca-activated chloride channel family protein